MYVIIGSIFSGEEFLVLGIQSFSMSYLQLDIHLQSRYALPVTMKHLKNPIVQKINRPLGQNSC